MLIRECYCPRSIHYCYYLRLGPKDLFNCYFCNVSLVFIIVIYRGISRWCIYYFRCCERVGKI